MATTSGLVQWMVDNLGLNYVYASRYETVTEAKIQKWASAYPSIFTSSYITKARKFIGQTCADCSGIIYGYTGVSRSSSQMRSVATQKVSINNLNESHIGWVLWKSGHVGVYIGNGMCIEARGIDYGCVRSAVADRAFKEVLLLPELTDNGATADGGASSAITSPGAQATYSNEVMFEVAYLETFTPITLSVDNQLEILADEINKGLGIVGLENIEPQLMHSEFSRIRLHDLYGSNYIYYPEYMNDVDGKTKMTLKGALGDVNKNTISIDKYARDESVSEDVSLNKVLDGRYAYVDAMPRSLTVITDQSEAYMQSNKNQIDATRTTFNESGQLLEKQESLSNRQTDLQNEQATYNSQYAIDSSKIGLAQTGFNAVTGVLGNILQGNVGGALMSGVNSGFNTYNSFRAVGNAEQQGEFTQQFNSLRSESNSLANMQSKLALNQSIRAFNASIKDVDNQPNIVQQIGDDLSFNYGNKLSELFLTVELPHNYMLKQAQDYIFRFGVMINKYINNIKTITQNRRDFNYIKMTTVDMKNVNIPYSHAQAIKAMFMTGVRIWNFNNNDNFQFLNFDVENKDL